MTKKEELGKLTIIGSSQEVARALSLLLSIPELLAKGESEARLLIQDLIDKHKIKATIMFDGNTVWSKDRIIRNLKQIIEAGTLYNGKKPAYIPIGSMLRMPVVGDCVLSTYFYSFLNLKCGSIAHYNKQGWVTEYPTVDDLREFFQKNEYGKRVLHDVGYRFTDAKRIVEDIEKLLNINDLEYERENPTTQPARQNLTTRKRSFKQIIR